jgi:hypothetical protein
MRIEVPSVYPHILEKKHAFLPESFPDDDSSPLWYYSLSKEELPTKSFGVNKPL